jgi:2'-5' RNA ligase
MQYFIAIVPPEHISKQLIQIQQQFGDNRLEPHITIRPPVSPLNEEEWLDVISRTASMIGPFTVKLPGIGQFGKRVLYVRVDSPALSGLYDVLIPNLKAYEPEAGPQQQNEYHPHLTLSRTWCGFTSDDFTEMGKLAREYLESDEIDFIAEYIRIYYKPSPHSRYQCYRDVPLQKT